MPTTTVAIETLGCKVNQYESSHLMEALQGAGYTLVPFDQRADAYIVHSCAVTAKASGQTRQLLRRARRSNPAAAVLVLGCNAQVEPERFVQEGLASHILGSREKFDLLNWLARPAGFDRPLVQVSDSRRYGPLAPLPVSRMLGDRARAFLKIQDGCNAFCSYCVVPQSRGRSRSLQAQSVLDEFARLAQAGYREVVLTGIHLGQWGHDLSPREDLSRLLTLLRSSALPDRTNCPVRIRLSSLEPREWTPSLLSVLSTWPRVCPHFHVPLQSGDRDVLQRMGRPYSPDAYEQTIRDLHRRFPHAAIGADVMVGFPGETERRFQHTFDLIERSPLTYLHVFPFSPRPGTAAAGWSDRITGTELKRRAKTLRELGERKRLAFEHRQCGRWSDVLVESNLDNGCWKGTSENYLPVRIRSETPLPIGEIVRVRLQRADSRGLEAGLT